MSAWIEIEQHVGNGFKGKVALLVSAWIEIQNGLGVHIVMSVALLVRAWIEIGYRGRQALL